MRCRTLAILTGLMVMSLVACGKSDTGVVINAEDSAKSTESIANIENTEKTKTKEEAKTGEKTEQTDEKDEPAVEVSLMGIWSDGNTVFTFDNNNEFSLYQSDTDTYTYGTYKTDNKKYVELTEKANTTEQTDQSNQTETETAETAETAGTAETVEGYIEETAETNDENVNTVTTKYDISFDTSENEYGQKFIKLTLKGENKEYSLTKTVDISNEEDETTDENEVEETEQAE